MPLYDVVCDHGHRSEVLVKAGEESFSCPACQCSARRVYGYRAAITVAPAVDSRGMFRRFTEASAELEHRGYRGPSLWHAGKRRAAAIERAGEGPVARSS